MVISFRARRINRDARKLVWTTTLIKEKQCQLVCFNSIFHFFLYWIFNEFCFLYFILQHLIDFKLFFSICFSCYSMRLSQTQANISAFDWCLILWASIVIILLDKKIVFFFKSKVVKFHRVHDLICWFGRLCCEALIDLIFCRFHIKKILSWNFFKKSNHVFHLLFRLFLDLC
jgi:hypothetical protein